MKHSKEWLILLSPPLTIISFILFLVLSDIFLFVFPFFAYSWYKSRKIWKELLKGGEA